METIGLMHTLHTLSRHWHLAYSARLNLSTHMGPLLPCAEFLSAKLTAKANRQLQDPLVIMTGHLPGWLPALMRSGLGGHHFLFPFETRLLFFGQSRLDRDRALQRLLDLVPELNAVDAAGLPAAAAAGSALGGTAQAHQHHPGSAHQGSGSAGGDHRLAPRLERRRRQIARGGDLLRQCDAALAEFARGAALNPHKPPLLEIQYENEVGTGLGPTLEFYSLVSLELQRCEHEMWRGERRALSTPLGVGQAEQLFFTAAGGLFPAPIATAAAATNAKLIGKFRFLGKFLAKALMDSRVLDIGLSLPFYKWLLDPALLCEQDLRHIDAGLYRSVESLRDFSRKRRSILAAGAGADDERDEGQSSAGKCSRLK